ncbi:hypothetical protein OsJ_27663 [Oryza sativa Japonica Group]|uniref:Uncharacterized protein n=1 Tax=Oryza sativa subsp. japonica TaxID=39947 RepID=A3BU32_ORYSJ|nr:hypothetical protein OsJ_27663 [Oryza sativa Japonica Group]
MGDRADDEKAVLAPTLSCADLVRGDGSRAAGGGDARGGGGMAGSGTLLSGSGAGGRAPTPGSEAAGARGAGRRWLKAAGMAMAAGTELAEGAEAAAAVPWLRRRGAWRLRRWCPPDPRLSAGSGGWRQLATAAVVWRWWWRQLASGKWRWRSQPDLDAGSSWRRQPRCGDGGGGGSWRWRRRSWMWWLLCQLAAAATEDMESGS